jgi:outer membrane protein, heavy metal efflux system
MLAPPVFILTGSSTIAWPRFSVALVCLAAALSLSTRPAHAEARETLSLSLADALESARKRAPEVALAEHAIRQAEARGVGAGLIMPVNPRLSFDVRPPLESGSYRDSGYAALLEFTFEAGGAPHARVKEAEREVGVARADFALDRASARLRAFTAYVRVQIAELRIAEAGYALQISKRLLDAAEHRVRVGAASELEQASAELEFAQVRASEVASIRDRDLRLMELRDALDLTPTVELRLTSPILDPPELADVARLLDHAARRHPLLSALKARAELLEATQARLEKELFPRLGLYTAIDAAPLSPTYGVLGVSIELPCVQRNQGPRAVVERAQDALHARVELEARRLARNVVAAWDGYRSRRLELEHLTQNALPVAERTLLYAEAGWQAGRFDLFRLLAAARDALRVRAGRIDVLEAAWLARIDLERAVGEEVTT